MTSRDFQWRAVHGIEVRGTHANRAQDEAAAAVMAQIKKQRWASQPAKKFGYAEWGLAMVGAAKAGWEGGNAFADCEQEP